MQGDSSSTSRPGTGGSSGTGSTGTRTTGTSAASGATSGASGSASGSTSGLTSGSSGGAAGRASGSAGGTSGRAASGGSEYGSSTYGGSSYGSSSYGGSGYEAGAYGATEYDTEADDRLAQRRARALDAANGEDHGRTLAFGAGIAVGALLGAGLALLLAPQSGRQTRAFIARGARRIPERARDSWDDLGEELRTALRRRGRGVRRGMRDARWKAEEMMDG